MTEGFRRSATSLCSSVKTHFLKIPWPFALLAVPVKLGLYPRTPNFQSQGIPGLRHMADVISTAQALFGFSRFTGGILLQVRL